MPNYYGDPYEYIKKIRESKPKSGNSDLFSEAGANINFRRKPWDSRAGLVPEDPGPLTPGDPDFAIQDYLADAQTPSAYAETVASDAAKQAQNALDRYGAQMDPATRKKLEAIAKAGVQGPGSSPLLNVINVVDTLGETVRLGVADIFGADERAGVEITGQDYLDAFLGREQNVRDRLGAEFVGEDQFLMSGSKLMENLGWEIDPDRPADSFWRAAAGFVTDVVLDPATYVSFGTVGLGKQLAMEAAQEGISRGAREGIEAVAKGTVKDLKDSVAKEYATRVTSRINERLEAAVAADTAGTVPEITRMAARQRVTAEVIGEERRILDAADGLAPLANARLDRIDDVSNLPYIPRGTVVEEMVNPILEKLVDKQFRSIAQEAPWYMQSQYVKSFGKGGIQIGAPFGRKRFPFLRIPGTETNRLASRLLGRGIKDRVFPLLPEKTQQAFRWLSRRTGVEKASYQLARDGELFHVRAQQNLIDIFDQATFPAEALRPLAHGITGVEDAAVKAGMTKADAHRLIRHQMAGQLDALEGAPPEVVAAVREAVHGDADRGLDGILTVTNTIHDAAIRVGLKVGRDANYMPMVVTGKFGKLLDYLAAEGTTIPLGKGSSDMSNIGLAILARYTHNTGASALGLAGANPTYSQFAQSNNVTRLYRNMALDSIADDPNMVTLLHATGTERMTTDFANEAVAAALEDMVRITGMSRSKLRSIDEAFHTDLRTVMTAYTESMNEAIQGAAKVRELKRYGMIREPNQKIAVSNTLASVRGRLTPTTAEFIEGLAAGEVGAHNASKLIKTSIGGRSTRISAAVMAHPRYKGAVKQLEKAYSRLDRRLPEIKTAVARLEGELLAAGLPAEWAQRIALADADVEFGKVLADLAEIAAEEGRVIQQGAAELAARGVADTDRVLQEAADEARKLSAGVKETIETLEASILKKLEITKPAPESVDVAAKTMRTKQGEVPMLQGMAEEAIKSGERRAGRLEEYLSAAPERIMSGATPAQIAREAADDLADRLTVANVTVGDLVEFGNPAYTARVLIEINDRLLSSGYRGVESLTDDMMDAAREVLAAEKAAAEAVQNVWIQRGYSGVGFDEDTLGEALNSPGIGSFLTEEEKEIAETGVRLAREAQDAAKAAHERLVEVAAPLRQSDELLGDLVEHVAEGVAGLQDTILQDPLWRDVWAVAIQKTGRVPRAVFNEENRELASRGLVATTKQGPAPELIKPDTQKDITRSLKGEMRNAADDARALWLWAAGSEEAWVASQAVDQLNAGGSRLRRAMEAMLRNDTDALIAYQPEFQAIVAGITDKTGRQIMDPSRFVWRDDGRLIYEAAEPTFVTLPDVMPDIRLIVGQPNLPDLEQLQIARRTWDDNPAMVAEVSPQLDTYFRQLDEVGGLPQELEDYDYLVTFAENLAATSRQIESQRSLLRREGAWEGGPRLYHGAGPGLPDQLRALDEGGTGSGSENIFGPGFYTTDDGLEVATTPGYGGGEGGEIAELRWTGERAPRLLDLERPAPQHMRRHIMWEIDGETGSAFGFYASDSTKNQLRQLINDPKTTGDELYTEYRNALRGFSRAEADEALLDLNLWLREKWDVMRHMGGHRTGSKAHLAHVWLSPEKLAVRKLLKEGQYIREPRAPELLQAMTSKVNEIMDAPDAASIARGLGELDELAGREVLPRFRQHVESIQGLTGEAEEMALASIRIVMNNDLADFLEGAGATFRETALVTPETRNALDEILVEVPRAIRRDKGSGPRSTKLNKMWDNSREALEQALEPDEFERLRDLVSLATASKDVKPSRFPQQLRTLTGTTKEAEEIFVRDIARMRMEGHTLGGPWVEGVIDDTMAFRAAFERLQRFAPGDGSLTEAGTPGLRAGAEDLVDVGGEFDDALHAYRRAGNRLLRKIERVEKKPQLAAFLPELPDGIEDMGEFAARLRDEMLNWEPTYVATTSKQGFVNAKIAGLIGEQVAGTEMSEGVALMLEHLAASSIAIASPMGIRLVAESVREIEKWWKSAATVARPTFVPRNMVSGTVNGLLVGVGPRHYAAVNKNVMRFKHVFDDTGVYEEALAAVPKSFQPYMEGLWKSQLLETTFGSTIRRLQTTPELRKLIDPRSSDNIVFRAGAKFMETSEDVLRAAAFIRWYDPNNPASMRLAKEMALAVHFDYNSLTRLETAVKRLVPFFVWTRRNLPLQMRAMVEQPGHMSRLLHLQQNVNDAWEDNNFIDEGGFARSPYLSSFAMNTPLIFEEDTPFWQRLIIDPQLPVSDLEDTLKAFSEGPAGMASHFVRMVSPVYSTPFEWTANADYEVAAPTGLREIMMWTDWLRPGADKVSGDEYLVDPNLASFFSTAFPFFAEWTRTAGLVPSGGNAAARAGYNIEDGVSFEERLKASALSLGRGVGAQLQTPADTSSAAWRAIFDDIEPAIDDLHITGQAIEPDDVSAYIAALLAREGITDESMVNEIIESAFVPVG